MPIGPYKKPLSHTPCKPGVESSIPGFSTPFDETINRGPMTIFPDNIVTSTS